MYDYTPETLGTDVSSLITFYRKQRGITIEELSELSGVPKGTLNKIIAGTTKAPTLDNMKAIARALGRTLADFDDPQPTPLVFRDDQPFVYPDETKLIQKYRTLDEHGKTVVDAVADLEYARVKEIADKEVQEEIAREREQGEVTMEVPLSLQPVAAGTGTYLGPEAFKKITVKRPYRGYSKVIFAVRVQGDSMEPLYHDGDVLLVSRQQPEYGEIGVFTMDGRGYVKQLGEGQLISLNPAYEPIPMDESIICNGKVLCALNPADIIRE